MDYFVIDPSNVAEAQKFMGELCPAKTGAVFELPKQINPYIEIDVQFNNSFVDRWESELEHMKAAYMLGRRYFMASDVDAASHQATEADMPAIKRQEFAAFVREESAPDNKSSAKPAITGLTTEWRGDHRLGMFK